MCLVDFIWFGMEDQFLYTKPIYNFNGSKNPTKTFFMMSGLNIPFKDSQNTGQLNTHKWNLTMIKPTY